MQYTEQTFFSLMDAVDAQGGEHMERTCGGPKQYMLSGENGPSVVALRGHDKARSMFAVPYESPHAGIGGTAELCAVDDALGAMPRFGGNELAKLTTLRLFALHGDRLSADDPRMLGE